MTQLSAICPEEQLAMCMQTPDHLKTRTGEEAYNDNGLVQRSIRLLKDTFPDLEASLTLSPAHGKMSQPCNTRAESRDGLTMLMKSLK